MYTGVFTGPVFPDPGRPLVTCRRHPSRSLDPRCLTIFKANLYCPLVYNFPQHLARNWIGKRGLFLLFPDVRERSGPGAARGGGSQSLKGRPSPAGPAEPPCLSGPLLWET
ncbi:hypothetical protein J6590_098329 [Homalodisca vitripennis]|nr:hypothetical protein J6590_098329 [Homalodisca vitripennis]